MRIGPVTPTGIASTVGLIALTIGLIAGVPIIYLIPPVVALLSAVGIHSAWRESRQPATDDVPPRRPTYWFVLALGYLLAAAVAASVLWVYFKN